MKVSRLIELLQEFQRTYGDAEAKILLSVPPIKRDVYAVLRSVNGVDCFIKERPD